MLKLRAHIHEISAVTGPGARVSSEEFGGGWSEPWRQVAVARRAPVSVVRTSAPGLTVSDNTLHFILLQWRNPESADLTLVLIR